jgi:hypothetical protein
MFNCASCKSSIGPGVSPNTIVTATRDVEYHNAVKRIDEYERETIEDVHSKGSEIVSQALICNTCAKVTVTEEAPVTTERKGGKSFEEKLPEPLRVSFAGIAAQSVVERLESTNKRLVADRTVAVPLIKDFADRNKEFLF